MATIFGMLNRMEKLDTVAVIEESFDATTGDLEDVNRERMLDGVKADGSIMPNYSFISQVVYGYPNSPIKLKATGDFQKGITVKRSGLTLDTTSSDSKTAKLVSRFGEKIFGTSGSYKKQYQDDNLRPAFKQRITRETGLKFKK